MQKVVGAIFGEAGLQNFKFIVSSEVKRNEYVKIWSKSDTWTLAKVTSIVEAEKKVATAEVIGYRDEKGFLMPLKTPYEQNSKVLKADPAFIVDTLGLRSGEMYIGLLDGHDIPVYLRKEELIQKHCSILAKTGSGKSYTAAVLIEELLDENIPLLIIDPHGEYTSLKYENSNKGEIKQMSNYGVTPKGYGSKVVVYTPSNFTINPSADELFRIDGVNMDVNELSKIFTMSDTQLGILYQCLKEIKEEKEFYKIEDIIDKVMQSKSKAKWRIIRSLEKIRDTGILSDSPTHIDGLIKAGQASIIDMKGVEPELQQVIVYRICRDVFEGRKIGRIPPLMLIVEEAHNFSPEKGFGKAISSDILRTIASEGRKFGLGLLVISQRPARVDKNVLSQCNTQIILKITNVNDIRVLSKSLEFMSAEMEEEIKRIPQGVALVSSTSVEMPILVDIRVRRSEHGGRAVGM